MCFKRWVVAKVLNRRLLGFESLKHPHYIQKRVVTTLRQKKNSSSSFRVIDLLFICSSPEADLYSLIKIVTFTCFLILIYHKIPMIYLLFVIDSIKRKGKKIEKQANTTK